MKEKVLVTGVSGFLAGHVALELLNRGYSVRGSLRNLARADSVSAMLDKPGRDSGRLDFCQLDLLCDDGWADAVQGCRYVVHIASPFVLTMPKESDEILRPALDGTRRMILAALDAGVERIVLTSSVAAIDNGHRRYDHVLGPDDWTDPDGPHVTAYTRSKTLAEREAWAIAEQKGDRNVLAVINPGTIIGPLLDDDPGTSGAIIQRLLRGGYADAPQPHPSLGGCAGCRGGACRGADFAAGRREAHHSHQFCLAAGRYRKNPARPTRAGGVQGAHTAHARLDDIPDRDVRPILA